MRKLVLLLVSILFCLTACSDSSVLAPEYDNDSDVLSKKVVKTKNVDLDDPNLDFDLNLFDKSKAVFSQTYTVDGSVGDKLYEGYSWRDENGKKVTMAATLEIPKGAYEGELTFDLIFDLENLAVELYPSPFTFDIPVILDLKFSGVDLSDINEDELTFNYLDGEEEDLEIKKIKINKKKGSLVIQGAKIPHFSRYGWSRRR